MKIGIITYHRSTNYGAQLQAYALTKVLQSLGHDAEIIDCNNIGRGKVFHWSINSYRAFMGSIRNNLLSLITEFRRNRFFDYFVDNYILKSRECFSLEKLNEIVGEYDFIITGSDQVWHPQICEGKTLFFLDLPISRDRKIAYAPSFGVSDYSISDAARFIPLIADIKHLSVRESTGNKIIHKYLGKEVTEVADPTMLLRKNDWETIIAPRKYNGYIFYFTILDEPEWTDKMVRDLAKQRSLKIIRIGTVRDIFKPGFINARISGPQDFLSLVRYADTVVTSSFHGLVFSILFQKDFYCVLNNNDRNSRLIDLATKLGVTERLINNPVSLTHQNNINPINYKIVGQNLDTMRQVSLKFLKDAIR